MKAIRQQIAPWHIVKSVIKHKKTCLANRMIETQGFLGS